MKRLLLAFHTVHCESWSESSFLSLTSETKDWVNIDIMTLPEQGPLVHHLNAAGR